jgi:hypothetical protein
MFTAIAVVPFDLVSASLCRKLVNFSTESCFKPCNLDLVVGKYAPLLFPPSKSEKKSTPYILVISIDDNYNTKMAVLNKM